MATYTSFLNLEKPTTSERLDVLKINSNWDKIDEGVSSLNSKLVNITTTSASGTTSPTGSINLTSVLGIYSGTRSIIALYAESSSYPNGLIAKEVKLGSSYFAIVTDTAGNIAANASVTIYATIAQIGFG